ncbi:replication initiation protein, partial [Actinocrinis puniceicyclus]|nr:replication initiation protein [Actinocrinis puniceicyclus]
MLFNALASKLWKALTDTLYHRIAALGGVPRPEVRRLVRVEYVKVAEFQARGVVHFHVVLRLDGAEGAGSAPPMWATAELLAEAVRSAAAVVSVAAPSSAAVGDRVLRFGSQLDVQPIEAAGAVTDRKVSRYLAKYTTKSTEDAGG